MINETISIAAFGGTGNYSFSLNGSAPTSTSSFNGLDVGRAHVIGRNLFIFFFRNIYLGSPR